MLDAKLFLPCRVRGSADLTEPNAEMLRQRSGLRMKPQNTKRTDRISVVVVESTCKTKCHRTCLPPQNTKKWPIPGGNEILLDKSRILG